MKRIGVLTSGGDAPGMNAAVRAVTRAAIAKGYEVIGIKRGYNGLLHGEIVQLGVRDVSNIIQRGGTVLYTARCLEFKEWEYVLKAKEKCDELNLVGIVVIGGDGSFRGAADLSKAGVPCIGLPGTIDNDIACTEYTIGYDTAMNTAMEMIDKVMGRNAGWIALNVGLAVGAVGVLAPEVPRKLDDIISKMENSKKTMKQHFIIVVSEGIGHSEEIAQEIKEKTGIESRATILGHVQRGGNPTLRDRVVASEMGYYAVDLLDQGIGNRVVAMQNHKIVDFDIKEALEMKKPFDVNLYNIADKISF